MTRFGRYNLGERIGVGGMAEVFLARSSSLDGFEKELVIKRMRPDLSEEDQFAALFIDEARLSIQLSHPNIAQVFDFGEVDGAYYIAMEYVQGCDLAQFLRAPAVAGQGVDPGLALVIAGEVLRALDYAHNKTTRSGELLKIVHRDVSPQNIMVSWDGAVKLTDFGVAKMRLRSRETAPNVVLGKLAYMPPEQLSGEAVDARADLFALGVVLWEMLTGRSLYGAVVESGEIDSIAQARIPPPSKFNPDVPPAVDAVVAQAVAKSRDKRFAHAMDFGSAVHEALVASYPKTTLYSLQGLLTAHRDEILAAGPKRPIATRTTSRRERASVKTLVEAGATLRREQQEIVDGFKLSPSLWEMVRLGDLCRTQKEQSQAAACYRLAAFKFAQRGLLAQALLCTRRWLECSPDHDTRDQAERVPEVVGCSDDSLRPHLFAGGSNFESLLAELVQLGDAASEDVGLPTPLLSHLDGHLFVELALQLPLMAYNQDQAVVSQGEMGRTMYIVARGRVLVFAGTGGQRICLSSFCAGEFFGENSFFTGAPRSATVEVLDDAELFVIDRAHYNRMAAAFPAMSGTLLQFYKERIVDTLLATSPIFGVLDGDSRRLVLDKFVPRVFRDDELVVKEGETNDQIYLIKEGEADVQVTKDGKATHVSRLGPGTFFGELAALRKVPRTASVIARGKLEVMELPGSDFLALVERNPDVKRKVMDVVAQRVRDNLDRLWGSSTWARRRV